MARKNKKALAYELYINTSITRKEGAERFGVTEKTFGKWVKDGSWDDQRTANNVSRQSLLKKAYKNLERINKLIDECEGAPSKQLTDAKSVFVREVQALDKQDSLSQTVSVMERFLNFLYRTKPELAKEISMSQLEFLEEQSYAV